MHDSAPRRWHPGPFATPKISVVHRFQAFKFELRPNGKQERSMRRFAGACRFVYNRALALQKERFSRGEGKLSYAGLCKALTQWRREAQTKWLAEAPRHPLGQALRDLEWAYTKFFAKRAAFPKFKKRGQHDSFRYPDPNGFKIDQANARIFLPKLGWMRLRLSRKPVGTPTSATVILVAGKWYVSIHTKREVESPEPRSSGAIGIDVGIARFATLSDGSYIAPANSFRRHEKRLRAAQRSMSRKLKFSQNWRKCKVKIQRVHARIANVRRDFLHKATTSIAKDHGIVCIEDLRVTNMSKSARGSAAASGEHVRIKSGLNKSILDQGWYEFRRQLAYKLLWSGGSLVTVSAKNTSRTCPACGWISQRNRQTQSTFLCVNCGYEQNADVVGAINILARGHRVAACGEAAQ